MFYTPDTSKPAFTDFYQRDHSGRVTLQAGKNKVTGSYSYQDNCACNYYVQYFTVSPEAVVNYTYVPITLTQGTWSYPASNRLLFEAGGSYLHNMTAPTPWEGIQPGDISITELSRGYQYNAYASASGLNVAQYGQGHYYPQHNERFSMSYVTGSHAFKAGATTQAGFEEYKVIELLPDSVSYQFFNGRPSSLSQWASPSYQKMNLDLNLGLYAQDQWTVKHLTLNLGVRYDHLSASVPAQTRPGGLFAQQLQIQEIKNVPNWNDLAPRLGLAYDIFGNGRTAAKVQVGRYVVAAGTDIARAVNPSNTIISRANRTWNDSFFGAGDPRTGNYKPDCDLFNRGINGECGQLDNSLFGTSVVSTRIAKDVTEGFAARPYDWQTSMSVQHELLPGTSVEVGYFRTSFGGFSVTDNTRVSPGDYNPFCVTAPADSRLPGGGGNQICGLYDINPSRFGQFDGLVDLASKYGGEKSEVYNGFDISFRSRFGKRGGLAQGGVSIGKTVTNNCQTVDVPNAARAAAPGAPAQPSDYCKLTPPWSADSSVKLSTVYPLPYDMNVAATYQNLAGVPLLATAVYQNAQVKDSLGRDLAAGAGATVQVDLVKPQTMFDERINQIDLRLNKTFRMKNKRLQAMFDIYNITNANAVTGAVGSYGAFWLRATQVMGGRLFKLGAQYDF